MKKAEESELNRKKLKVKKIEEILKANKIDESIKVKKVPKKDNLIFYKVYKFQKKKKKKLWCQDKSTSEL